jgi:hypothetical protein
MDAFVKKGFKDLVILGDLIAGHVGTFDDLVQALGRIRDEEHSY